MSDKAKTSKRVATEASEILRSNYQVKPKSVAGSALAQTPDKKETVPRYYGRRYYGQLEP
jgi:hypothetical protein